MSLIKLSNDQLSSTRQVGLELDQEQNVKSQIRGSIRINKHPKIFECPFKLHQYIILMVEQKLLKWKLSEENQSQIDQLRAQLSVAVESGR